jgi:hypothetical protein
MVESLKYKKREYKNDLFNKWKRKELFRKLELKHKS